VKVVISAGVGFVATLAPTLVYWWSQFDSDTCSGDECALEWAAVVTLGIVASSLVGLACGFVAYALTRSPDRRDSS
jgi:hypothetical protein